jgi:toxin ParE1/3/4
VPALEWRAAARADLLAILDYVSDDSPDAAQCLIDEIAEKARKLVLHPKLYKTGRVQGTREMVVRTNYVVVYMENEQSVSILRVLHVARQWPPDAQGG